MFVPLVAIGFFALTLFVPAVAYVMLTRRIQSELEALHDDVFGELGRPRWSDPSIKSSIAFTRFMWSARASHLEDDALRHAIVRWRVCALWCGVGAVMFASFLLWGALTR